MIERLSLEEPQPMCFLPYLEAPALLRIFSAQPHAATLKRLVSSRTKKPSLPQMTQKAGAPKAKAGMREIQTKCPLELKGAADSIRDVCCHAIALV